MNNSPSRTASPYKKLEIGGHTLVDIERDVFPTLDALSVLRGTSDDTEAAWKLLKEMVLTKVRGIKDDSAMIQFLMDLNERTSRIVK